MFLLTGAFVCIRDDPFPARSWLAGWVAIISVPRHQMSELTRYALLFICPHTRARSKCHFNLQKHPIVRGNRLNSCTSGLVCSGACVCVSVFFCSSTPQERNTTSKRIFFSSVLPRHTGKWRVFRALSIRAHVPRNVKIVMVSLVPLRCIQE